MCLSIMTPCMASNIFCDKSWTEWGILGAQFWVSSVNSLLIIDKSNNYSVPHQFEGKTCQQLLKYQQLPSGSSPVYPESGNRYRVRIVSHILLLVFKHILCNSWPEPILPNRHHYSKTTAERRLSGEDPPLCWIQSLYWWWCCASACQVASVCFSGCCTVNLHTGSHF